MREKSLYLVYTLTIILILFTAGCVTPLEQNSASNPNPSPGSQQTPTQASYVTEVALSDYASSTPGSAGYTTYLPTTQIPADITCRIHSINVFGYNGTAFIFNLKNPPMYINYTVVPTNVTVNKVYTDSFTKKTTTYTYSDYSPSSWFDVTVRDNATKEIILKEGFGENKGYSTYLTRTLKVMKNGDLLVEFRGNNIKASATIWVKPIGNFDESHLSEFTDCMYWDAHRDTLETPVQTTIANVVYTWTPENQLNG
ncbi:MAG: hypothetical protein WCB46_07180 [Methanoregula sp.]